MQKKANPIALLPVLVFLALYLGLGLVFEYIMKIPMGFLLHPDRRGIPHCTARRLHAEQGAEL